MWKLHRARRSLLEDGARAETAERELVKLKILLYLESRIGEETDAVITGVADYGFFAQAERFPAEGLVHISSLVDDYYWFDEAGHTLEGKRTTPLPPRRPRPGRGGAGGRATANARFATGRSRHARGAGLVRAEEPSRDRRFPGGRRKTRRRRR